MPLTFKDLLDRLRTLDEITLLEELEISSEDLVDRFPDLIEAKFEKLSRDLEDEDEEDA
jgi:hypothetical protein